MIARKAYGGAVTAPLQPKGPHTLRILQPIDFERHEIVLEIVLKAKGT